MGIDPGQSGGIAVVSGDGILEVAEPMPETDMDLLARLQEINAQYEGLWSWIEFVGPMPKQGVVSVFRFGQSYGALLMAMQATEIGFEKVVPTKWMKQYGFRRGKDESKTAWKNRLKARAQQLYPDRRITLATSDAVLIAHACMTDLTYGRKRKA